MAMGFNQRFPSLREVLIDEDRTPAHRVGFAPQCPQIIRGLGGQGMKSGDIALNLMPAVTPGMCSGLLP